MEINENYLETFKKLEKDIIDWNDLEHLEEATETVFNISRQLFLIAKGTIDKNRLKQMMAELSAMLIYLKTKKVVYKNKTEKQEKSLKYVYATKMKDEKISKERTITMIKNEIEAETIEIENEILKSRQLYEFYSGCCDVSETLITVMQSIIKMP